MTVPIQSDSHPLASQGIGYFPQAETILTPPGQLGGVFYLVFN